MSGPYEGLKILDFTHVIAGPFCTRLLADLGADVIKVESATGDIMRQLPIEYAPGQTTAFAQYNCGKRSIGLDLKTTAGLDVARGLVGWADVVTENFSPGAMTRLGLGWDQLHELNPRVILLSLSLFGQTGPYSSLSGHGAVAEAYSGLMMLAGEEGGPPTHFGTPLADMTAGVHGVAALGAALYRRAATGLGCVVDISSFDALFSMIDQAFGQAELTGGTREFGRYGSKHPQTVPSGVLGVADGDYVTFGAVGDAAWRQLATAMGRPELGTDPAFAQIEARIANRVELYRLLDDWAATIPDAATMIGLLAAHGLRSARIRRLPENLHDEHLLERGTIQEVDFGQSGRHLVQSAPYRISATTVGPKSGPPALGEHTLEILHDLLGLPEPEVERLIATRAAFQSAPI